MERAPGRFGSYVVEGELGRGATSIVLRARGPDGQAVAIKWFQRGGASVERIGRERALQAELGLAAGFVPLLDAGDGPAGPWLVMPLIPGGTLRERLRRGPLPVGEAIELVAALARALGRAHARGVVHRDLKPENILFEADGRPLVADLGLARRDDAALSLSLTGELRGTAGYAAPEQLHDAKRASPAADVFALGAILHECLAGTPAFRGESALEVLDRVLAGRPDPPPSQAPRWLARIVGRCLAADPASRFADGSALRAALVSGPPRGVGLLVGLAVVVGLGLAAAAALLRPDPPPAPPPTEPAPPAPTEPPAPAEPPRTEPPPPPTVTEPAAEAATRLAAVERALAQAPDDVAARALRGRLLLDLGRPQEAKEELDRVVARRSEPEALELRALARARLGDLGGARADLDVAIERRPSHSALELRGEVLALGGDDPGALRDFDASIRLGPTAVAHRWRSELLARRGDITGALADADQAIALAPADPTCWGLRGSIRHNSGDPAGAARDYTRALEVGGGAEMHRERGRSRLATGDAQGALADLDRALALTPRDPLAVELRGDIQLQRARLVGTWTTPLQDGVSTLTLRAAAADGRSPLRWDDPTVTWQGVGLQRAGRLYCSWGVEPTVLLVLARAGATWRGDWCPSANEPLRTLVWPAAPLPGTHQVEGATLVVEPTAHAYRVTWTDGARRLVGVGFEVPAGAVFAFGDGDFGCTELAAEDDLALAGPWIDRGASERGLVPGVHRLTRRDD